MKTRCAHCGFLFKAPDLYKDSVVKCPKCGKKFAAAEYHRPPIVVPTNALPAAGNFLTNGWQKCPTAFKNGFLATFGVLMAIIVFLFAYNHIIHLAAQQTVSPALDSVPATALAEPRIDPFDNLYSKIMLVGGEYSPMLYTIKYGFVEDSIYNMTVWVKVEISNEDAKRANEDDLSLLLRLIYGRIEYWLNLNYELSRPCKRRISLFTPGRYTAIATLSQLSRDPLEPPEITFEPF